MADTRASNSAQLQRRSPQINAGRLGNRRADWVTNCARFITRRDTGSRRHRPCRRHVHQRTRSRMDT